MLLTKTSYFYIDSKAFQSNIRARKFFSVFTFSTHGCYHPIALGLKKLLNAFVTPMGPLESFLTDSNHSQELSRQKREKALICGFSKFLTQFSISEVNFGARKFFSVLTFSTHGCYYPIALGLEKLLNVFLTPFRPLESFNGLKVDI